MPKMSSRISSIVTRILLILFGLFFSLLFLESFIRITRIGNQSRTIIYNNTLLKGKPNAKFVYRRENTRFIEYNNWGFHDRDQTNEKKYDIEERILFLGDSFLEARQVAYTDAFPSLLEAEFEARQIPIEIINAGVNGTGTAYQYLLWKEFFKELIEYDHIVLIMFLGNDLENNHIDLGTAPSNYQVFLSPEGNTYVNEVNYSTPQKITRFLSEKSALVNTTYEQLYLLKRSIVNSQKADAQPAFPIISAPQSEIENFELQQIAWDEAISGTLSLLDHWNLELKENDISFSIVIIQPLDYYDNRVDY
jgi:lysophospholipase L1-like esterase